MAPPFSRPVLLASDGPRQERGPRSRLGRDSRRSGQWSVSTRVHRPPLAQHFATLPDIPEEFRELFWYDWGPVFYRGRLTGKARFLGIASDPGPTERLVGRTLVGDAGQRVQGFLDKLGLTHSYVLVNAFPVAVHPASVPKAQPLLEDEDQLRWRNRFYDLVTGPGARGDRGLRRQRTPGAGPVGGPSRDVPTFKIPHPSNPNAGLLLEQWRTALPDLRAAVTPDDDGSQSGPNYGSTFKESDYQRDPPGRPALRLPALGRRRRLGPARQAPPQQLRQADARRHGPQPGVAGADAETRRVLWFHWLTSETCTYHAFFRWEVSVHWLTSEPTPRHHPHSRRAKQRESGESW